jgi:hypothetical protein
MPKKDFCEWATNGELCVHAQLIEENDFDYFYIVEAFKDDGSREPVFLPEWEGDDGVIGTKKVIERTFKRVAKKYGLKVVS